MRPLLAATAVMVAGAGAASAHVLLNQTSAPAGSDFRAVFTVQHGCVGGRTSAVRIRLDDRIVSAVPMPQPGWTAQVTQATPTGAGAGQPPREVSWTGRSFPGLTPDTFTLLIKLPTAPPGTVIYFPTLQECGSAVERWIETPLPGEDPETLDHPAPFLTLTKG